MVTGLFNAISWTFDWGPQRWVINYRRYTGACWTSRTKSVATSERTTPRSSTSPSRSSAGTAWSDATHSRSPFALYQRRIASADLRYADTELIQAGEGALPESHCTASPVILRAQWVAAVETVDQVAGGPEFLAAEVAAFLRRCLSPMDARPERFTFTQLDQAEHYTVYFIQPAVRKPRSGCARRWPFFAVCLPF